MLKQRTLKKKISTTGVGLHTGCKVTLWSPGQHRDCKPFNISSREWNTTAWLCCDAAADMGAKR